MGVAPVSAWQSFWAHAGQYGPRIDGGYPFAVSNLSKDSAASDDVTARAREEVNELCKDIISTIGGPVKKTKPATIEGARIMYVTTDEVKAETDAVGVSQVADTKDDPLLVPDYIRVKLNKVPEEVFEILTGTAMRPPTVCLCGSTKFKDEFEQANRHYTMRGYVVLAPGVFGHADGIKLTEQEKARLDKLHFDKIDMADEVVVVTRDGYVGESTQAEILYALKKGKQVRLEQTWPK